MRINAFFQMLYFHWKFSTVWYYTMCQFIQHDLLLTLNATTASRPGGFMEGGGYYGINETLSWENVKFYVVRHPEIPGRVLLIAILTLRLQKRKRNEGSP
jgi:hypothetical protein